MAMANRPSPIAIADHQSPIAIAHNRSPIADRLSGPRLANDPPGGNRHEVQPSRVRV
jgi:hypothetical protein